MAASALKNIKSQTVKAVAKKPKRSTTRSVITGTKVVALDNKIKNAKEDFFGALKGKIHIVGDIISPMHEEWNIRK